VLSIGSKNKKNPLKLWFKDIIREHSERVEYPKFQKGGWIMMKSAVFKKVGIGLSSLFLITALGLAGCASQQQLNEAVKKAEDAAARAEAAAAKAEAAAAKCEKTFQKGLQK
jgi:hypothetical protein